MNRFWRSKWTFRLLWLASASPFAWLVWRWYWRDLGVNPLEYVARYTGSWALRFLLLTLAITPLRLIPGLSPLIKFRRMLGLFAFFYASLHAWHYFAIDIQWNREILIEDLTIRRFFIAGMISLLLMVPLALTSFDRAIRWMGGERWRKLHRLVYASAIAACAHYLWQGKAATPTPRLYAALTAALLLTRLVVSIRTRRWPRLRISQG
ncbi:MAG: sulfoxide reductase heme-binding subunit YedZ [Bryobacteraceae bacterium]|nr:sulfoxide reductase heme-binding subunit YedZ [Bryobacteraceae bacterium]MDW8376861.1 protein-methionine-sulfoxide reductase heme-binding subunit MsrQ [Bryobacterales bacterium]